MSLLWLLGVPVVIFAGVLAMSCAIRITERDAWWSIPLSAAIFMPTFALTLLGVMACGVFALGGLQ